jgi:hypothetical protein
MKAHQVVGMAMAWIAGFMGGWTAQSIVRDYVRRKVEVRCMPQGPITKVGKLGDVERVNGATYECEQVVKWPKP